MTTGWNEIPWLAVGTVASNSKLRIWDSFAYRRNGKLATQTQNTKSHKYTSVSFWFTLLTTHVHRVQYGTICRLMVSAKSTVTGFVTLHHQQGWAVPRVCTDGEEGSLLLLLHPLLLLQPPHSWNFWTHGLTQPPCSYLYLWLLKIQLRFRLQMVIPDWVTSVSVTPLHTSASF